MTCGEMERLLISRHTGRDLPADAAEHLAGCQRCRNLAHVLEFQGPASVPSPDQLGQIKSALLRNLSPVRPLPSSRILLSAFTVLFLALMTAGSLLLGTRGWQALTTTQKWTVFAPLITMAALLAIAVVRQMAPGSGYTVSPTAWSAGIFALLASGIAVVFQRHEESGFVANGLLCLRVGLAISVPAAFLFWLVLRRGATLSLPLTGATAGGLAGLVGLAVLEFHCPNMNGNHVLAWHLAVAALSALGGLALGAAGSRLVED